MLRSFQETIFLDQYYVADLLRSCPHIFIAPSFPVDPAQLVHGDVCFHSSPSGLLVEASRVGTILRDNLWFILCFDPRLSVGVSSPASHPLLCDLYLLSSMRR
jgi:hypothetical protein